MAALVVGCANATSTPENAIGMTTVRVVETGDRTMVIGRNSEGEEIARLDLFRGRFTLSPEFADGGVKDVVGRKLEIRALDQSLRWETEGFGPTLSLPAHPAGQWALAAFVEDDRIERVLRTWNIAFATAPDLDAYDCTLEGTHPFDCTGLSRCPTLMMDPTRPPPNSCGAGGLPTASWSVHQRANAGYHIDKTAHGEVKYDQSVIAQCCPPSPVTQYAFFGKKACPDRTDCTPENPCPTSCGDVPATNACKPCPIYPKRTNEKCTLQLEDSGRKDELAPGGTEKIWKVCARYNWRCGDNVCDVDEDCDNCESDCGCTDEQVCFIGDEGAARCRDVHESEVSSVMQ